jgi:hypothetical protein
VVPKYFPSRSAIGAVIGERPCTMSFTRAGFTSFWLTPEGFMNSSSRISPGGMGASRFDFFLTTATRRLRWPPSPFQGEGK